MVCVPLEEYRNNRGFLHRERLEEEADFSSVGTCYVTEGEKREWTLGKYKYRLAALGEDIVDNIENIRIYVRGHNLYDIFYGRYKKQENEILTKYIEAAPREIFADILEKIDAFVYFDSRKKKE